jgi:hypothetical protein
MSIPILLRLRVKTSERENVFETTTTLPFRLVVGDTVMCGSNLFDHLVVETCTFFCDGQHPNEYAYTCSLGDDYLKHLCRTKNADEILAANKGHGLEWTCAD